MQCKSVIGVLLVLAVVVVGLGACRAFPTRPAERDPIISSVEVFPQVIGQGDSTLITVFATDPDGDTLVYDWETDGRLIIKDNPRQDGLLYNTASRSHVFYRSTSFPRNDTVWVWCTARDGRGGGDTQRVRILLED